MVCPNIFWSYCCTAVLLYCCTAVLLPVSGSVLLSFAPNYLCSMTLSDITGPVAMLTHEKRPAKSSQAALGTYYFFSSVRSSFCTYMHSYRHTRSLWCFWDPNYMGWVYPTLCFMCYARVKCFKGKNLVIVCPKTKKKWWG